MKWSEYSRTEKFAIGSLFITLVWAWLYFFHRHEMSNRWGHAIWPILGFSGMVMLGLMLSRKPRFRWAYVASFGLATLALGSMMLSPDCPTVDFGDCPPANIDDWMQENGMSNYVDCVPAPYRFCYDNDGLPYAPNCLNADGTRDADDGEYNTIGDPGDPPMPVCQISQHYANGRHKRIGGPMGEVLGLPYIHEWPPPSYYCALPQPACPPTIIGSRMWMLLSGMVSAHVMVGFLIPLVGMSSSAPSNNTRRYPIERMIKYGLFFVGLFIIFLWAHYTHSFYKGAPWYWLTDFWPDLSVAIIFLPATFVHLFSCAWKIHDC